MRWVGILVCVALVGCSDERTDSTNIANSGVYPTILVEDDGGSTRVKVELDVGGPSGTNLTLTNGESLQVTANGQSVEPSRERDTFNQYYEARLPTTVAETLYRVDWYRSTQPDLLGSVVTVPLPFAFTAPAVGAPQLSSVPINVQWSPASPGGRSFELRVSLRCTATGGTPLLALDILAVDDDGSHAYSVSDRLGAQLVTADRTRACELAFRGRRESAGSLASGFTLGGSATGRREVNLEGLSLTVDH